jgi:hypothetical protein
MTDREAGHGLGENPNRFRYAAPTGTVLIRWDGARAPTVWTVPPEVDRMTLAASSRAATCMFSGRRHRPPSRKWAGIGPVEAQATFDALGRELMAVRTPIGESWILTRDEPAFRGPTDAADAVRLLPSGDAYFLSTASIASSWSPMPPAVSSCGPRACGQARCSSRGRSSAPGDVRRRT